MNTCRHDPSYRQQNEAAGGQGCPLCIMEQRQRLIDGSLSPKKAVDLGHIVPFNPRNATQGAANA